MGQGDLDTTKEPRVALKRAWRELKPPLTLMVPPLTKDVD